ncbi:MAG: allophanate hydrolase subunit 2 family protein, partial [Flavobacteriia bacterium]
MDSHILILSPGFYTGIQDLGRKRYRSYGVPISGAMDKYSMILANNLLGNESGMPVMEITQIGPKIMFENCTLFVVTGADLSPKLNDKPIELNMVYSVCFG